MCGTTQLTIVISNFCLIIYHVPPFKNIESHMMNVTLFRIKYYGIILECMPLLDL